MKSIKRGRGNALFGGILALLMSIGPFTMALSADGVFSEFSMIAALIGVVMVASGVFNIYSATRRHRFSEFDITDGDEEPDPLNRYFSGEDADVASGDAGDATRMAGDRTSAQRGAYCPYCGAQVDSDYEFCASCGRKLPARD